MNSGKDAIIYIPGLIRSTNTQQADLITQKFALALDRIAERPELIFRKMDSEEKLPGENCPTLVHSLAVKESAEEDERIVADVYHFDYRETLTREFKARRPFSQILIMMFVAIATTRHFFLSLFRSKGKGVRDKLQMITVGALIFTVVIYLFSLIAASISTQEWGAKFVDHIFSFVEGYGYSASSIIQKGVVLFTAVGLLNNKSLKKGIGTLATSYVCATNYIRLADRKPAIVGELAALLEHISEKTEPYRKIHIVSYSFGTLVALDFLFPHQTPTPRSKEIQSLTTIGCPFDLVRGYWPEYFGGRNRHDGVPKRWINHFSPLDVFGSNFRDDADTLGAEKGIGIGTEKPLFALPDRNLVYTVGESRTKLNPLEILTVKGIKIHAQYWNADDVAEISCFEQVFSELYRDEPSFKAP